jgi:tryptophan halogenase
MKLCIIGGSTAGWWTAGYFEKHLPDWDITLYDSPNIPGLGVGESTLPQLKWWWEELGIQEKDWVKESNAVLKYGNYKEGWNAPEFDKPFVTRFWFNDDNKFDQMMSDPANFDENGKIIEENFYKEFDSPDSRSDYAYHVCAESSANIVRNACIKTKYIEEEVDELPPGFDLYVDATGFKRKFVQDFTEMNISDYHFVDSAWVCPMEKSPNDSDVTKSIARKYGWTFEVNLQNRVGMGYIFSSRHVSAPEALKEFQEIYAGYGRKKMLPQERFINWEPKILQNPWAGNVVAIGTSSGFVDPLEATALFNTQSGIKQLANTIKRGYSKKSYNRVMRRIWNDGLRFQLAHYTLSSRKDTQFWIDSQKGADDKFIWDNYQKYSGSYQWIFPDGIWCQLGIYLNKMDHYAPKL